MSKVFVEGCFDVSGTVDDGWSEVFVGATHHDVWVVSQAFQAVSLVTEEVGGGSTFSKKRAESLVEVINPGCELGCYEVSWGFAVAAFIEFWIVAVVVIASVDVSVVKVRTKAFQHLVQIVVGSKKWSRAE